MGNILDRMMAAAYLCGSDWGPVYLTEGVLLSEAVREASEMAFQHRAASSSIKTS